MKLSIYIDDDNGSGPAADSSFRATQAPARGVKGQRADVNARHVVCRKQEQEFPIHGVNGRLFCYYSPMNHRCLCGVFSADLRSCDDLDPKDLKPVLSESEGIYQIGPAESCHEAFVLSVTIAFAANLPQVAPLGLFRVHKS